MNKLECEVQRIYERKGCRVLRSGWPDFLMIRGRQLFAVEVKSESDEVSAAQRLIFDALSLRLPVFQVRPGVGYADNLAGRDGVIYRELLWRGPDLPVADRERRLKLVSALGDRR
jgi:hypothetical protein